MNFDFSFLNQVEVITPEKETRVNVAKTDKYPTEGTIIRVWANGNIFPSPALVAALALEYVIDNSKEGRIGNGLDVFAFSKLPNAPKVAQDCIMISAVLKSAPKVDLFGSCKYDEAGQPKSSVLTQGGGTFGEEFIAMIKEVYGIEIPKGTYLDLEVKLDISPKVSPIVYLPKIVDRGPKKGQPDVARRENISIYPLVPIITETTSMSIEKLAERQLSTHDDIAVEAVVNQEQLNVDVEQCDKAEEVFDTQLTGTNVVEEVSPVEIPENAPIIWPTL